jgi:hypothetical protein
VRANVAAASGAYSAYIWKDFSAHSPSSTLGIEQHIRVKSLPSTGSVGVLGVTKTSTLTDYLAYVKISSTGALALRYHNGTSLVDSSTLLTVQPGQDLRLDLTFTGLGTAGAAVVLRVKQNDRAPVSTASLTTGNQQVNRVLSGFFDGTTGATTKVLIDRLRVTTAGISEGPSDVPGSMVEYWAPEGQPAGDEDHFMTGIRYPVKPSTTYVDSVYLAHDGITTPTTGAGFFRVVSFDADGEQLEDHGFILSEVKGKSHWDRYYMSYTTPADAAYVEYTRNHVGDGLIWAMGFQHETGTTPSPFINTNATSGTFNVIFKTTLDAGPKKDDLTFNTAILRARAIATQVYDANDVALTSTKFRMRAADTLAGLASATYGGDNVVRATPGHHYIEMEVTLTVLAGGGSATISPEVTAVFVDVQRDRPILTHQDGRDFQGGVLVYNLTPASPVPNVVRKEFADGTVGLESVGRSKPPERLKMSLQALTEAAKRGVERTPATEEPHFVVETADKRYEVAMIPEFTGNVEEEPDGVKYWDYVAEDITADVVETEDL